VEAGTSHVPVLLDEVLEQLDPRPGQTILDGTLGGGGHARALARRVLPTGVVIALDRDPGAVRRGQELLRGLPVQCVQANFAEAPRILRQLGYETVDAVLLDLGLSSDQLADTSRGFSFTADGPLDLRFDPTQGEPAWRLVNRLRPEQLADLLYRYGEERHSRRIARAIAQRRQQRPVMTAAELADIVRRCVPRRGGRIDPATRTFQALRIAVNDELQSLQSALDCLPQCVRAGGRVAVISFHSLEDRIVKQTFRSDPRYRPLTRRPIRPGPLEQQRNPRARSARLRVAEIVKCA
jgi:16S rRNA (cytosine1402-N4)-methyltransferase